MRAPWRRGLITLVMGSAALLSSGPVYSVVSSALHTSPTASISVADQVCPQGLNWDNVLQRCD